jgi:fructokinase
MTSPDRPALNAHTATVVGESVLDVVQPSEGPAVERPGGSPLNVAVTLARLGVSTQLVTALGDDRAAELIERHLAGSGVWLAPGARCLPATSTAVAHVRADGSAEYRFDIRWDLPAPALEPADVVHAGSLALFLRPGSQVVQEVLQQAAEQSLVSLDPNIRTTLLPGPEDVRPRFEALAKRAHVVKMSDEDAHWLYPELRQGEILEHVLGLGPSLTAISRGSEGALLASPRATVEIPAPRVHVADTIGAGDAFMGGLLTQLLERDLAARLVGGAQLVTAELEEIGSFAATVAAITVSRRGADPPYRAELRAQDERP